MYDVHRCIFVWFFYRPNARDDNYYLLFMHIYNTDMIFFIYKILFLSIKYGKMETKYTKYGACKFTNI